LNLNNDQIGNYLTSLDNQSRALKKEALQMAWYMRGGLSYDDAMSLSQSERELISNIIKDNMETTEKTGLPFF
jgi:hypothetical protein